MIIMTMFFQRQHGSPAVSLQILFVHVRPRLVSAPSWNYKDRHKNTFLPSLDHFNITDSNT